MPSAATYCDQNYDIKRHQVAALTASYDAADESLLRYFVRVNCPMLAMPLRKKFSHPVR